MAQHPDAAKPDKPRRRWARQFFRRVSYPQTWFAIAFGYWMAFMTEILVPNFVVHFVLGMAAGLIVIAEALHLSRHPEKRARLPDE